MRKILVLIVVLMLATVAVEAQVDLTEVAAWEKVGMRKENAYQGLMLYKNPNGEEPCYVLVRFVSTPDFVGPSMYAYYESDAMHIFVLELRDEKADFFEIKDSDDEYNSMGWQLNFTVGDPRGVTVIMSWADAKEYLDQYLVRYVSTIEGK